MHPRLYDLPVYASRTHHIEAPLYNLWRRTRKRLRARMPLRIELPDMKEMALIIEPDCWVVVDESRFDLPVLAWLDFQDKGRDTLHTPVACTLNYYHFMASGLRGKVLGHLQRTLEWKARRWR